MRAVVQRVSQASVQVDGACVGSIGAGLLVLLGVAHGDTKEDAEYLADKVSNLRIFEDQNGKMNHSLIEIGGGLLAISQFTLYGDCRKGRRPDFAAAAPAEIARSLYAYFIECVKLRPVIVATGIFQAEMRVTLTNEGPVTLILESKKH